jgi:hypothetical protein
MNVTALRSWHWMIIGLLIGAGYGYLRESASNFHDELTAYGPRRIGQREFETALTTNFHGRPRFSDITIIPHRLTGAGGPAITVHVVSGLYWDGRTQVENGKVAARWEPAYFVASAPYFPIKPSGPQQFENVMAYLRSPRETGAVQFQYSSWWWVTRPLFIWTCAGFTVIGVVWPAIVNLLAFGTLLRPAEAKGLSLWKVRPTPAPQTNQSNQAEPDSAALEALERRLEAALSEDPLNPSPVAPPQPAVQTLRGAEPEKTAVVAEQAKKDFGADKEDFYPTELRAKHGK